MMDDHGTALKVGLSSALLVLGLIVAAELPSSALSGKSVTTVTENPPGHLAVVVTLNNGSLGPVPLAGVRIGISQFLFHGANFAVETNRSGIAEVALSQGEYGVDVSNSKFALSTQVQVEPGKLTLLDVGVNRSEYFAAFASAEDPTTQGEIQSWNTLVALLLPYGVYLITSPTNPGVVLVYQVGQATTVPPKFGTTVFLQTLAYHPGGTLGQGFTTAGPEVSATVVAQSRSSGQTWLTLMPSETLRLSGAQDLVVISYQVGSSVSIGNG